MVFDALYNQPNDLALLVVRIVVGSILIYYGWPKIKDLKKNGEDFNGMGFKPGILWGTLIALVEFVGGILIIIGLYVIYAALLLSIMMIVGTIWKKTKTNKKFSDWSYDLLLLALALGLITIGPGRFVLTI